MSTALATLQPAALKYRSRGSGTAVATLEGSVSAFFTLEGFDRRRGVATYALRVVNRTNETLICHTWVVTHSGDAVLAHPISVEVAPLSTSTSHLPVWQRDFGAFDRAIAEIAGEGVHCIVEAPAPAALATRRTYAWLAGVTAGVALAAILAVAGLRAALPHITAFAVPPEAIAGTTVRAEYSASGAGRLSYMVLAPDGHTLQSGALTGNSGAIPVPLPVANDSGAYTLHLVKDGPLGSVVATRVLNAVASRAASAAQIEAISVTPPVVKPGEAIDVAYSATGDAGYVRLMGTDGTIWQEQPFSRAGQTHLLVPQLPNLREMRVMLHVTKGRTAAESMAGLVVAGASTPADRPEIASAPSIAGDDEPTGGASTTDANGNGTFALESPEVKSGGSIPIRVLSPRNGMRISLTDAQSHEVAGTDVGAEATAVTLRAPIVYVSTRYTVVANFTDGFGQESVVEPITITP